LFSVNVGSQSGEIFFSHLMMTLVSESDFLSVVEVSIVVVAEGSSYGGRLALVLSGIGGVSV
jgi:hypothetical protein